jgi:hypothetical protein
MGRLLRASLWLFVAQVVAGALYWVFLITPESNVAMLAASAGLGLLLLALASLAAAGAVGIWHGDGLRAGLRRPGRAIAAGLLAAVLLHVVVFLSEVAFHRLVADEAGIRAMLIARFGWADATPLFTAAAWVAAWLRWVVAPLLACSAFAAWLGAGARGLAGTAWLRRALSPLALVTATAAVYVLVYWPWQWVEWRPTGLPPTWVEPVAAAAKLAAILLAMSAAWALIVRVAARPAPAAT